MYAEGMSVKEISRVTGMSLGACYRGVHRCGKVKGISAAYAVKSGGYEMGTWAEITRETMQVVAKNIRPNETIVGCMVRIVAQHGDANRALTEDKK